MPPEVRYKQVRQRISPGEAWPPEVRYKQVRQRISPGEAWRLQLMAADFVSNPLMGYH